MNAPAVKKCRYELRALIRARRDLPVFIPIGTLTVEEDDPYAMACQIERIRQHPSAKKFFIEVRDHAAARGKLAPIVSYEELIRRAKRRAAQPA